jgi:2-keto-4-pentenoate hydratase/2-oxohepta-3-ene-1,7-dioic acid hydratase in catechol pathway
MKLVTFTAADGAQRIGSVLDDLQSVADFRAGAELLNGRAPQSFDSMLALIHGGTEARAQAEEVGHAVSAGRADGARRRMSEIRLLAPLPRPEQMRDFLCFELHYKQARARAMKIRAATYPDPAAAEIELNDSDEFKIPPIWYEQAVYYKGNRFSVVGTETDILWPRYCKKLDFELEFGVILGKSGKNISREKAAEHIYGYCIFNDMSARDAQYREYPARLGPAKGKDFDTGNVMGPWLVTADEVGNPYDLTMVARINGEEWGRGNSGTMYHKFEDMIAHASSEETLHPGEFLGSGTVGNGCGLEHDRWLRPGDLIELEVSKLGTLRNRVVAQ